MKAKNGRGKMKNADHYDRIQKLNHILHFPFFLLHSYIVLMRDSRIGTAVIFPKDLVLEIYVSIHIEIAR